MSSTGDGSTTIINFNFNFIHRPSSYSRIFSSPPAQTEQSNADGHGATAAAHSFVDRIIHLVVTHTALRLLQNPIAGSSEHGFL
jgi:hypothetical protein